MALGDILGRLRSKLGNQLGNQGQVPVMAKPGKGMFGGLLGRLMNKSKFGGFRSPFLQGRGNLPQGAGPFSGGMQRLGMFKPGMFRGNYSNRLKQLMERNRRPFGGGQGRPGGPSSTNRGLY